MTAPPIPAKSLLLAAKKSETAFTPSPSRKKAALIPITKKRVLTRSLTRLAEAPAGAPY